jgi:hypothetical protein
VSRRDLGLERARARMALRGAAGIRTGASVLSSLSRFASPSRAPASALRVAPGAQRFAPAAPTPPPGWRLDHTWKTTEGLGGWWARYLPIPPAPPSFVVDWQIDRYRTPFLSLEGDHGLASGWWALYTSPDPSAAPPGGYHAVILPTPPGSFVPAHATGDPPIAQRALLRIAPPPQPIPGSSDGYSVRYADDDGMPYVNVTHAAAAAARAASSPGSRVNTTPYASMVNAAPKSFQPPPPPPPAFPRARGLIKIRHVASATTVPAKDFVGGAFLLVPGWWGELAVGVGTGLDQWSKLDPATGDWAAVPPGAPAGALTFTTLEDALAGAAHGGTVAPRIQASR